ncbi:hypothetical protein GUITHDRAFT_147340 [Guillardia theta CCMP2712]|uniref:Sushi domain-containing protein n=1 Tax=Guillardia theta (strain CCMP2712) TaxID=905079 RepID=L1IEL7_GUITC|nr:hypothetical protein GUITHDRAFT_147340 [Guillardia theta CCMP2712]EKX34265.1 hypothetical protein GUITHDRAFT_147340 [Guillardia theta CCMP2712]|eukprot:XP_005821245.1 hypothetical protein GUITHDRAFT_147340 [Guillardia theta CCMP2712]
MTSSYPKVYLISAWVVGVFQLCAGQVCTPTKLELLCGSSSQFVENNGMLGWHQCVPKSCGGPPVISNGYTVPARGESSPMCNENCTFGNYSSCAIISCRNQNVSNGVIEPSHRDIEYGRSVEVSCNYGYMRNDSAHLKGDNLESPAHVTFSRICSGNGQLTNMDVSCVAMRCSQVTDKYLTCTDSSMCKAATGMKTGVANPARPTSVYETVKIDCIPGFHWSGGSNVMQCKWTGALSTVAGMCIPSACNSTISNSLLSWEKASTVADGGIAYKDSDHIVCAYGYTIKHSRLPSNSTCPFKMVVNCSWSAANGRPQLNLDLNDFSCVRAACPMTNLVSGLRHYNSSLLNLSLTLNVGDTVDVTCVQGYRAAPLDSFSTSCDSSRRFSARCARGDTTSDPSYSPCDFDRLHCVPVHCSLSAVPNGVVSLMGGEDYDKNLLRWYNKYANISWNLSSTMTANLSCDVGYRPASSLVAYPDGSSPRSVILSCSSECQLNYSSPSCKPVSCQDTLPAGHFVSGRLPRPFLHGDVYEVYCPSGTAVQGTTTCQVMYQMTCSDGTLLFKMPADSTFSPQQIQCTAMTCGSGCSTSCSFDQRFQDPLAETIPNTTVTEGFISRFFQCRSANAEPVDNECKQFGDAKCEKGCFSRLSNCNIVQQNCFLQLPPHTFTVPAAASLMLKHKDSRTVYCEAGYMLEDDTPSVCETVQVVACSCGAAPIKRCIPQTCASRCDLGCPASQLLTFPHFGTARYVLGPEISISSTIPHLAQLQFSCANGFVPISSNLSIPRPVCNPTSIINAVCRSCQISITDDLTCAAASCPPVDFPYKTSDGFDMVDSTSVPGFHLGGAILTGQRVNITCPVNYAVAGTTARTKEVTCAAKSDGTCGMDLPICQRVPCPSFTVPANSMATRYNLSVSPPLQQTVAGGSSLVLLSGDFAEIECNSSYRLSSSNLFECASRFKVTCLEDGKLLSSRSNSSSIDSCELQSCFIVCDMGYACASSDDPKLCSNDVCAFNAPRTQAVPCSNISQLSSTLSKPLSGDRCQYLSLNVFPCLPFRCVRFEMPANAKSAETVKEVNGQVVWVADTASTLSGQVEQRYGAIINVTCQQGFMPETYAGSEEGCPQSWYLTSCNGQGLWENYQRCVPKTCRVTWQLGGYWQYRDVLLGSSFQVPCSANEEIPASLRSSVCLDNCNMSSQQVCAPKKCRPYNVTGFLVVSSSNQSVTVGQKVVVRCPIGLVAAPSFVHRCSKTFESTCQADQMFDRQDLLQCVPASCRPYVEVDHNVLQQSNSIRPALYGQPCREFRCKEGHGLGGNGSQSIFMRRCGTADDTLSACEWEAGPLCEPVVCGKFAAEAVPANSTVTYDANTSYRFGQKLSGRCELGFHRSDQQNLQNFEISCLASGKFQEPPSCIPVVCPPFERYLRATFASDVWSRAPVTQSNEQVKFNETVKLLCPEGYEFDPSSAGAEQGVKVSDFVANPTVRSYGDKIVIECQDGFQLTSYSSAFLADFQQTFGVVKVLASKRYALPPLSTASQISMDGPYSDVKISFPANSWPPTATQGPEIIVFNSSTGLPNLPATAEVAGVILDFGPSGIKFQNPVKLSIPTYLKSKPQDLEIFIYRY